MGSARRVGGGSCCGGEGCWLVVLAGRGGGAGVGAESWGSRVGWEGLVALALVGCVAWCGAELLAAESSKLAVLGGGWGGRRVGGRVTLA